MNLTENAIEQAIQSAPPLVRVLAEDDAQISDVTFTLGTKHALRADALGVLFDCTRAMLVGLISPQEVIGELAAVGVAETTAREILADLNTQIFTPLRAEMQKVGMAAVKEKPVSPAPVVPTAAAPQVPMPNYSAPPLQSPRYTHLENKISITTVAPLPPKMNMPSAPPVAPAPAPVPVPAPAVAPAAHTGERMLPSGAGESHAALPSPQPAVAPISAPQAALARPSAPAPTPRQAAPIAPEKLYAADPYREPVEG